MSERNQQPEDNYAELPDELREAVAAWEKDRIFIPAHVHEAVLGAARRHLRKATRRRWSVVQLAGWAAALAWLVTVIWPMSFGHRSEPLPHRRAVSAHRHWAPEGASDWSAPAILAKCAARSVPDAVGLRYEALSQIQETSDFARDLRPDTFRYAQARLVYDTQPFHARATGRLDWPEFRVSFQARLE